MNDIAAVKKRPNKQLVETLEGLLDLAKRGELQGVAYCSLWDDESTSHGWAIRKGWKTSAIIGEAQMLQIQLALARFQDIDAIHEILK